MTKPPNGTAPFDSSFSVTLFYFVQTKLPYFLILRSPGLSEASESFNTKPWIPLVRLTLKSPFSSNSSNVATVCACLDIPTHTIGLQVSASAVQAGCATNSVLSTVRWEHPDPGAAAHCAASTDPFGASAILLEIGPTEFSMDNRH